jgi:hypothetical protein
VFVDKPLLRQNITAREKNQMYYDSIFKSLSLKAEPQSDIWVNFERGRQASSSENIATAEQGTHSLNLKTDNLTYNLWTFGNTKILIRCKIHGVIKDPSSQYNQIRMVGIKTKLEMDYEAGGAMEEVTIDETARWWIYTYIRPDAHLILGNFFLLT